MELATGIGMVKDVVLTVGGVVAMYVALKGLSAWRRQLKGNSEYEAARKFLRATLVLRNALTNVRSPVILSEEIQAALREHGPKDREPTQDDINQAVYQMRWNPVVEARTKLFAETIDAEVLWGRIVTKKIDSMHGCTLKLFNAVRQFVSKAPHHPSENYWERMERIENIIYPGGQDDVFAKELEAAVNDIDTWARPFLSHDEPESVVRRRLGTIATRVRGIYQSAVIKGQGWRERRKTSSVRVGSQP